VSDIFREIDEEVRRENFKKLWERHGTLIVAAVVLFVLAVAGWRGYEWWQAREAARTGTQFEQAVALIEQGKHAEARAAFATIAAEGSRGYRPLARLREAAALGQTDPAAAVAAYDKIAADTGLDATLRELAALHAGALMVDTASYEDVLRRLEPLAGGDRTFRHSAREYLALSAWRASNTDETRRWIEAITADPETPPAIRSRSDVLSALVPPAAKS